MKKSFSPFSAQSWMRSFWLLTHHKVQLTRTGKKIEKRGSIKVATAGTLYPQTYHDDDNNFNWLRC